MHFFDYDSAKYISTHYLQSVKASEDHNVNAINENDEHHNIHTVLSL